MRKDLYTNGSVDIPRISKKRSFFDLSHSNHLDMNAGVLYPIDCFPIMPGDSMEYGHRLNIRMTNPPKTPTMDQLVLDLYYFYSPNRIVWEHWDQFITNNSGNYYVNANYTIPILDVQGASTSTYFNDLHCSVLDYLGYGGLNQLGAANNSLCNPNALPVRMYYKIWNEYFRFSPLQTEVLVPTNDTPIKPFLLMSETMTYYDALRVTNTSWWSSHISKTLFDCVLMPVNRLPGYFSRALPQPIAGAEIKILEEIQVDSPKFYKNNNSPNYSLLSNGNVSAFGGELMDYDGDLASRITGSLGATASNSIRALSNAFALNKFLYIDNLYGKRITEWTYGHFGVQVPDSRVQRPEFLGKKRVYININQIMQTSETDTTAQGHAGAWSQTFDQGHDFTKSFVEFGYVIGVACIRVLNHSFAQGVDKHWSARTRFDFPMLEFVNTGDEEVKKFEIFFDNNAPLSTWGYQERYASWKMIPSRVCGQMRPTYTQPLSIWTYTDYYSTAPTLSATWIMEPRANIDNTLYVSSSVAPSFILDYVADIKAYRTLPYHSIPGGLTGSL